MDVSRGHGMLWATRDPHSELTLLLGLLMCFRVEEARMLLNRLTCNSYYQS